MPAIETEAMFTSTPPGASGVDSTTPAVEVAGAAATEIVTLWGDTVLGVEHFPHTGTFGSEKHITSWGQSALAGACMVTGGVVLGPAVGRLVSKFYSPQVVPNARSFTLGEDPKSDVFITPDLLGGSSRVTLVEIESQGSRLHLLPGTEGEITLADGSRRDLRDFAGGRPTVELPAGARARVRLGDFTFLISSVPPGRLATGSAEPDWTALTYTGFSFLVHAVFLFLVYFIPPDPRSLSLDMLAEENVFVRYVLVAPEVQDPREESWIEQRPDPQDQGGQGRRHEGDEGAMGRQDAKRTDNRFGIRGPADNPNPVMARERAEEMARSGGILAAINANAPTSPFGSDSPLGNDPENALGALLGHQIGESFGYGGLGLTGTGRGGGGDGRGTIGLGNLNTIGHGAGGGSGSGYGRGRGSLRGRPTTSGPVVRTVGATVRGSLSRDVIRRHIRRQLPAIRYCYEQQLARRPDLAGRVAVQFVIGASGAVASARVASSTMGSAPVEQCVARAVQRITFPAPDGGVVIVTYPFVFQSAGR